MQKYDGRQTFARSVRKGWEEGQAAARRSNFRNYVTQYCSANPGQEWKYNSEELVTSGHCPFHTERQLAVINTFMSKHKDIIPSTENGQAVADYIRLNDLNPSEEKSYERAFKDLKKRNQLQHYAH